MRTLFLILLVATLSGCALLGSPREEPVIEDHATNWFGTQKMGVFSVTAERREVVFKFPDNKFCSEPPPDVAEALTSSLTLLAKGRAKDQRGEVSAELEAAKTLATSLRTLFRRSQGAQFLRDGLFSLCQAYLNDAIDEKEYVALYRELLNKSKELIDKEIPATKEGRAEDAAENAASAEAAAKEAASKAADSAERAKKAADRADEAAKKLEPK